MSSLEHRLNASNEYSRRLGAWRAEWLFRARPKQIAPRGDWDVWNIIAGRGFGKTRIGAEESGFFATANPNTRIAVISPTQKDVRTVCFEGESGLIARIPHYFIKNWNKSDLELTLINGSMLFGYSAEKPDRLRGPQFHQAWCDETAAWGASAVADGGEQQRLEETWSNLLFALRLGDRPRIISTTTPRPLEFLRKLRNAKKVVTTCGSTFENEANLAASAVRLMRETYEGTRKGRQELHAEILDNVEGALWSLDMLCGDKFRPDDLPEMLSVVVGVDPAVTSASDSDEWGIVVAGLGEDGFIYVIADYSGQYSPRQAARIILTAYERHGANAVVGETNQGGDLVEGIIRAEDEDANFNFEGVHAKRGKYLRAEPVAAYYEKKKVRHYGRFEKLEKQMLEFVGSTKSGSPDRLDAVVYAIGRLMAGSNHHVFW